MLESRGEVKQRSILFGQYQIPVVAVPMDGGEITFNVNERAFAEEGGQSFSSLLGFDSLVVLCFFEHCIAVNED